MGEFVDSPMSSEFIKTETPKGSAGKYDGERTGPFGEFPRTSSPNGVPEKYCDDSVGSAKPSGEEVSDTQGPKF